ncbi:MAG: hypothetical protein KGJ06_02085 [Pseudomonadota bacterium]|nr:hypothetical protein [Pseudomonadota bacterium]
MQHLSAPDRISRLLFPLLCIAAFAYVFSYAWVTEDAYITFRVVDNAVHGFGLRWNIDERVQVYTHPLWMLIHIPFYAVFDNIFLLTIALSAVFGVAAVALLIKTVPARNWHRCLLVLLPLTLSKTFDSYVICGLETPLTFCTLAAFFYTLARTPQRIYPLLFFASLGVLTRFDNLIPLLPALLWLGIRHARNIRIRPLLAATLPLTGWCAFALFYYGFVFPNTKYAKLNTGIHLASYIMQGRHYLQNFFHYDLFAFVWISVAVITGLTRLPSLFKPLQNRAPLAPLLALGITASVTYVVMVGGDFMAGRFFAMPFFLSVILLYDVFRELSYIFLGRLLLAASAVCLIESSITAPEYRDSANVYANYGIVEERRFYQDSNALFIRGTLRFRGGPSHLFAQWGEGMRANRRSRLVQVFGNVGMYGYYAGPRFRIIDSLALADPLLARLPVINIHNWRIGHFERRIPPGYVWARMTGDTSRMPPNIRDYYDKLRLVISGNLFSLERLKTILGFQFGAYSMIKTDVKNANSYYMPLWNILSGMADGRRSWSCGENNNWDLPAIACNIQCH